MMSWRLSSSSDAAEQGRCIPRGFSAYLATPSKNVLLLLALMERRDTENKFQRQRQRNRSFEELPAEICGVNLNLNLPYNAHLE